MASLPRSAVRQTPLRRAPELPGSGAGRRYTGVVMPRSSEVHSDPEFLGGTAVFVGTRVPVQSLFDLRDRHVARRRTRRCT
jgi:hypothetical protein